jgi:hypothetical protein
MSLTTDTLTLTVYKEEDIPIREGGGGGVDIGVKDAEML